MEIIYGDYNLFQYFFVRPNLQCCFWETPFGLLQLMLFLYFIVHLPPFLFFVIIHEWQKSIKAAQTLPQNSTLYFHLDIQSDYTKEGLREWHPWREYAYGHRTNPWSFLKTKNPGHSKTIGCKVSFLASNTWGVSGYEKASDVWSQYSSHAAALLLKRLYFPDSNGCIRDDQTEGSCRHRWSCISGWLF